MCKHTHTHLPDSSKADTQPSPFRVADGGLPFLQEEEGLRKRPEPYGGEGREVKSVHTAFFLARSEAVRAKGVEFLVSKGALAKLLLSVAASLREMESSPCPHPAPCPSEP